MMIRDIIGFVALVFLLQPKEINAVCTLTLYHDPAQQGTKETLVGANIYYATRDDFSNDAASSATLASGPGEICCAHFYDDEDDSLGGALQSQCVLEDSSVDFEMLPDEGDVTKISLQDSVFLFPDNKVVSDQINDIHSDINENIDELDTEISNAVTALGSCFCGNEIDNGKNEIINAIVDHGKNEMNTNDEILNANEKILNAIVDYVKNQMNTNDEILNTNDEILNTNDEILSILRMILSRKSDSSDNVLSAGSINEEFDSTHGNRQ
eukprot:971348_1